jgi:hypothetical protein
MIWEKYERRVVQPPSRQTSSWPRRCVLHTKVFLVLCIHRNNAFTASRFPSKQMSLEFINIRRSIRYYHNSGHCPLYEQIRNRNMIAVVNSENSRATHEVFLGSHIFRMTSCLAVNSLVRSSNPRICARRDLSSVRDLVRSSNPRICARRDLSSVRESW